MQPQQHGHEPAPLLSIEEARRTLGVGRSKFDGLVQSGALPVVWVGARRRVRHSDLAAFIESLPDTRPKGGPR